VTRCGLWPSVAVLLVLALPALEAHGAACAQAWITQATQIAQAAPVTPSVGAGAFASLPSTADSLDGRSCGSFDSPPWRAPEASEARGFESHSAVILATTNDGPITLPPPGSAMSLAAGLFAVALLLALRRRGAA
jgi:hypothetical protein